MKAAVFEATKKPLVVKDHSRSRNALPTARSSASRPTASAAPTGIAWSGDWTWMGLASAQPGTILGHEFSGVVEEVGKDVQATSRRAIAWSFRSARATALASFVATAIPTSAITPLLPGVLVPLAASARLVPVPFADMNLVTSAREHRFRRGSLVGLPLHDFVSRRRRSRAGEAGRMGRRSTDAAASDFRRSTSRPRWEPTSSASTSSRPSLELAKGMGASARDQRQEDAIR